MSALVILAIVDSLLLCYELQICKNNKIMKTHSGKLYASGMFNMPLGIFPILYTAKFSIGAKRFKA
jgi:hypothetical protein